MSKPIFCKFVLLFLKTVVKLDIYQINPKHWRAHPSIDLDQLDIQQVIVISHEELHAKPTAAKAVSHQLLSDLYHKFYKSISIIIAN